MTQWADGSSAGPNSLLDLLDHSSYTSSISPHTHPPFLKKIKRQKYSIFRKKNPSLTPLSLTSPFRLHAHTHTLLTDTHSSDAFLDTAC